LKALERFLHVGSPQSRVDNVEATFDEKVTGTLGAFGIELTMKHK
jgi:hypothetical protein